MDTSGAHNIGCKTAPLLYPTGTDQRTWTVADSESPSGASACSVIEGRRPGTGGSSSGGVTSDGPSTPATEGISTTVLASPATTPGFTPQQIINPMEVLMEGNNIQRLDNAERSAVGQGREEPMGDAAIGMDVAGTDDRMGIQQQQQQHQSK